MRIKNRLKRLLLSLMLVSMPFTGFAQEYWFKNIGVADGLSSSQVNSICKDSKGFVWFGTSAGLDCYDGVRIRQFQSNFSSATALPDSYILSLQEGYDGMIWIKTNGGYVVLDPNTLTFDRGVSQRLSVIDQNLEPEIVFFDRQQNLWVYDKERALYYNKARQQLVFTFDFDDKSVGLKSGNITGISDCLEGVLAVYSTGLVCTISGEQKKVLAYNDVIEKNTKQEDDYRVFGDDKGNIVVYGDMHSFFYEKASARWYKSIADLAKEWGSSLPIDNELITSVTTDQKGNLWISTDRHGIVVLNPSAKKVITHIKTGGDRSLPSNGIKTLYFDDTNLLWVGSLRSGVSYYAPHLYMFGINHVGDVYGISEDIHGGMWYATHDNGLVYVNPADGYRTTYTQSQGLYDNIVSCVLAASDGTIWAGSNRFGLNCINSHGISGYSYSVTDNTGLKDNNIQALCEDNSQKIWIATAKGGLQCLNTTTGKFTNFNVQNGKLLNDNVTSLSTKGGQLVAGTANGIMVLNLSNNSVKNYNGTASGDMHFTSNVVTQVFIDSRGIIWIGTRDGLNAFDITADMLSTFRTNEGLLSNVIYGITEDKNHDMWVTTSRGVNRIKVQNASSDKARFSFDFYGYGMKDGLQGIEFNLGAIASTKNGVVYFGGQNGVNWTREFKKKTRTRSLNVFLSNMTIDGQPIEVGQQYNGKVILDRVLNNMEEIKVRSGEKEICITLGVDDYNHAEPARFMYRLEGLNDAWLPVTGDGTSLVLKDLKSGSYTLHVKAMLDEGEVVSEEHILRIVVAKPWYLRWWFFVLIGLVILLIVYGIYRLWPFVVGYYKQRHKEIDALKRKQEEIDSVAQEVRGHVVSIIPQLGLLQMEVENPEHKEALNGLHYSARQMLASLNKLKENQSLLVSDTGISTSGSNDYEDVLIGDDGPIEPTMGADEFLVSDEGIITSSGLQSSIGELKYSVYVVEQEPDMLEFVADCLKNTYRVRTFVSAEECLEAINDVRPSVIMCAETLQGMSGSALCEQLKNDRTCERIPFIITTDGVLTQSEIYAKHISLLADDYIPSPYNLQSVIVRINKLLGEPLGDNVVVDDTLRGAEAMRSAINVQLRQLLDQYIRQNIGRKDLGIEEMGKVLGISRTVLFRKIEHITKMSPTDYIRSIRLEEAAKLLESGFVTAAEVAQELGFGNLTTFSRFFQDFYGVLPSQYAEGIRANRQK